MENQKIAGIFSEIADILEIQGVNRFRYLAYRRAAQTVDMLSKDVRTIYDENPAGFQKMPGIGQDLSNKIIEILETGQCAMHRELLEGFNKGLLELLTIRGLGPKKVKLFYEDLGIDDVAKLKKAAEAGELAQLPRMGEKSQAEILKAIEGHEKHRTRLLLHDATSMAEDMVTYMKQCPHIGRVQFAGSCRRGKETIGDIDILATGSDHEAIIDYFVSHPTVDMILAQGDTKASLILEQGMQVDLRVVAEESFGAALYYFTGSKEHNIRTRKLAISKGLKINEYGIFKGENSLAGETEQAIFDVLKIPFIVPEMRRNDGEVEAAIEGQLPHLIERSDIRGDLHVHTNWTDGKASMEDMVTEAKRLGYEYLGLTDHSEAVRVANGMKPDRLLDYIRTIDALNKKVNGITLLKGSEIDILEDGSLDYDDELLAQLDLVNISVHSKFNLPAAEQTARIVKALSNPYVTVLNHPTGQIIKKRDPYLVDMGEVARAAVKNRVALEVNGSRRLDLNPGNIRLAKEQSAKFVISTDSHRVTSLEHMRFGVMLARRGWLEKRDVLNTQPLTEMMTFWEGKVKK
jgi:DNA polymerase (family X)